MTRRRSLTAVLDANVLYPAPLRDLLLTLSSHGFFQPRVSDRIHDEWMRNVLADRPDLTLGQLERTRELIDRVHPEILVEGWEEMEEEWDLPDRDDRHVVAAAIAAQAQIIVTWNTRDFPPRILRPLGLQAVAADSFLMQFWRSDPEGVLAVVGEQRRRLRDPALSAEQLLAIFRKLGLTQLTAALEAHCGAL